MEDLVAVKFCDGDKGRRALITLGRVLDPVDEEPLKAILLKTLPLMGFRKVSSIEVCFDLGDARDYRYFYEGILYFADRLAEKRKARKLVRAFSDPNLMRKEIYLLGEPRDSS